jgi:uncharacterized protein
MTSVAHSGTRPADSLATASILALGLVLAGLVAGAFFYAAQAPRGVVRVTGAATLPFESDRVKWTLTLMRRVPTTDPLSGYTLLKTDVERLRTALFGMGLTERDLVIQPVSMEPFFADRGEVGSYMGRQTVSVISDRVEMVEGLARDPGGVLGQGAVLQGSQLEYFYSGLTELKRSLLAKATEDAAARAREIAGDRLGDLIEAQAGVFQIREPYSNEVQSYGMYSTSTRAKEITVTVRGSYRMD